MRALRAWLIRLGGLFGKERRDREFAEEMEDHLRRHIEDNLRSGMSPEEAQRNALIKLLEPTKETIMITATRAAFRRRHQKKHARQAAVSAVSRNNVVAQDPFFVGKDFGEIHLGPQQ
jgi:hypothetical protein